MNIPAGTWGTAMLSRNENVETLLSYATNKLSNDLLCFSRNGKNNPTVAQVYECVAAGVWEARPIQIFVTQHLQESRVLQQGWINYLLGRNGAKSGVEAFVAETHPLGYLRLRRLLDELTYPFELTFLLDDIALLTTCACYKWCNRESLERFGKEMEIWRQQVEKQARDFFKTASVRVELWSGKYGLAEYAVALDQASNWSSWTNHDSTGLIETCLELDFCPWSCRELYREMGLTGRQIERAVLGNLLSITANFRLQANAAIKEKSILAWTSASQPSALWPVVLSNYDGQGYAASLVF